MPLLSHKMSRNWVLCTFFRRVLLVLQLGYSVSRISLAFYFSSCHFYFLHCVFLLVGVCELPRIMVMHWRITQLRLSPCSLSAWWGVVAGHTVTGHNIWVHPPLDAGLWSVSYLILAGFTVMHVIRYRTWYAIPQFPGHRVSHPLTSIRLESSQIHRNQCRYIGTLFQNYIYPHMSPRRTLDRHMIAHYPAWERCG